MVDTELVEFLRGRLAQAACAAIGALADAGPVWGGSDVAVRRPGAAVVSAGSKAVSAHIEENDPQRVMIDVEAKGRIIDYYIAAAKTSDEAEHQLHPVLRFLALPFFNHPDYQDRWKLDGE